VKELVEYIARSLVQQPEQVRVQERQSGRSVTITLRVASDDIGRVIGKNGRVANAIRALLKVQASKEGKRVFLEIE
jgi:predicted RNA-binding protein YlqC (UPF0109 family)